MPVQEKTHESIIGEVNFDENVVIDSNGEKSSIAMYLNKVTPRKSNETVLHVSAKQHYEEFSRNLTDALEPDSTSNNTEKISTHNSFSVSKTAINELLYGNPPIEPDSTSEGMDELPRKKKMAIEPMPEMDSGSNSLAHMQYLVDSESSVMTQQETSAVVSQPIESSGMKKLLDKPFECPIPGCSYRVKHRRNLYRHKRQKHGFVTSEGIRIVKKHVCNICGKLNLNYDNYKRHHYEKHSDMPENFIEKSFEVVQNPTNDE